MDLRRINLKNTPFMSHLLKSHPWFEFRNLPSNELFPTIITGVVPTIHCVWGVKLNNNKQINQSKIIDYFPDWLTTTVQCCLHFLTKSFDLAAIPPRRRREFDITRTKYKRRNKRPEAIFRIGGLDTILGIVGSDRSRYSFSSTPKPAKKLLPKLCSDNYKLELVELYSLDRYQQWNLDDAEDVSKFYGVIDDFLRKLVDKCEASGMSIMIFSDHGHEKIKKAVDIISLIKNLDIPDEDYRYFVEVSSIRLWFYTEEARQKIIEKLSQIEHGKLLNFKEMVKYNVPLSDSSYGEVFFFLDPGYIFFPHDFYQPLANVLLGLFDKMQRKRLISPKHRGNHGYLQHFEAERSFVVLVDKRFRLMEKNADILDLAPSILKILGHTPPDYMNGKCLFQQKGK
jgi:predicted AlkP superfamily pyrophosphatase or phosphodiesterase